MDTRIFCKTVAALSLIALLCVCSVPTVRESGKAPGLAVPLVLGIALNLYYSKRLEHRPLGSLLRRGSVRRLTALILFAPLGGLIFTSLADAYERRLPVFREAMNAAEASQATAKNLGLPISVGWPVEGEYREANQSARWVLRIPVSGHNHRGTILAIGTRTEGEWRLADITLTVDGSTATGPIPIANR